MKKTAIYKLQNMSPRYRNITAVIVSAFVASIILLIGLKVINVAASSQFEQDVTSLDRNIRAVVKRYEENLYSVNSFVVSNKEMTKRQFDKYLDSLRINEDYPSMSHIYFVQRVLSSQVPGFYENLKEDYAEAELLNSKLNNRLDLVQSGIDLTQNEHFLIKYIRGDDAANRYIGTEIPLSNFKYFSNMDLNSKLIKSDNFAYVKDDEYKEALVALNLPSYIEDNNKNILYYGSTGAFIKLDNKFFHPIKNGLSYLRFNVINSDNNVIYSTKDTKDGKNDKLKSFFQDDSYKFLKESEFIIGQNKYTLQVFTTQFPPNVTTNEVVYLFTCGAFLISMYLFFGFLKKIDYIKRSRTVTKQVVALATQANTDQLTGLFNRRSFFTDLHKKIIDKPKTRMFLFFIDLDGFKNVNDNLGHSAGDELLQQYTLRLQGVEKIDSFTAYRIGGDEFLVLVEQANYRRPIVGEDIKEFAHAILKLTDEPFIIKEEKCYLSQSIGVAEYPSDGSTPEELFKNSDMAMYEAKKNGKNCYVLYSDALSARIKAKNHMMGLLVKAIEKGDFYLNFQPKMQKVNGIYKMRGAEALMRWKNDQLGFVSPAIFIPLAEEAGLIAKIDLWLINEVGRSFEHWSKVGIKDMKISINVSARQFSNDMLPELFTTVLEKYNVKPDNIIIEITESATVKEPAKARKILEKFRSYGFGVSIDDFGTGYSSISYLRQFPATEIKVDKSFTDDITIDEHDRIIIEGIATMSRKLKLEVVMEGVETIEQVEWIEATIDNVIIQGYYFSKPLPIEQFIDFARDKS
jgi:diguanylate cyclase (GGDEF)-like protein